MYEFELRPNASLTPRAALAFYLSIVAVLVVIATVFAARGLWLVLPFAGLEIAGLGAALGWSMRGGNRREYVRIDERAVVVSKRSAQCSSEIRLPTPWTRVEFIRAPVRHWPAHLVLKAQGRSVEVGDFLAEEVKLGFKARLDDVIVAGRGNRSGSERVPPERQSEPPPR